jgi:hypothetical protein
MTNRRLDKGPFARVKKTPQGGIRVEAGLTRIGILTYRNPDGSERRELRHPDEVFRADSLTSLAGAPVLDGHSTWVTPETYSKHARGHVVEGTARQDGEFVAAELVVQDAGTLERVERRDLAEISCGYTCDYVPGEGTWNGQHYHGRQTALKYNHIALLPAGAGRAGRECSLRLDAASADDTDAEFVSNLTKETLINVLDRVDEARAELVASIKLLDPAFREDGLSTEYLTGRLDALNGDRSGAFSDGHRAKLEHVRDVRALSEVRREAPGIREDGSFSYADVERAAATQTREAWRARPVPRSEPRAETREDAAPETREDATFSTDEIQAASLEATRNAWKGGQQPTKTAAVSWERSPSGVLMGRV